MVGSRWHVKVGYIYLPGTFYENIKSAWESAEVNGTCLSGTFFLKIFKAPGKVPNAHYQGIVKETMYDNWRQCKDVNLS